MFHQVSENVYFGNWESPFECRAAQAIINVAHHFSERRGRNTYFGRHAEIPWTTFYTRLALKDRHDVTNEYMWALCSTIRTAATLKKLPILTHCQMGGHRGPSSAICAEWVLNGCTKESLDRAHRKVLELHPNLARGRNYYHSLIAWCESQSTQL